MAYRDDVLALSEEEGGHYPESLLENHLHHMLTVGFTKPAVRQEMRSFLRNQTLDDDTIITFLR